MFKASTVFVYYSILLTASSLDEEKVLFDENTCDLIMKSSTQKVDEFSKQEKTSTKVITLRIFYYIGIRCCNYVRIGILIN